jgi:2-polyprenyl-3-methyl-5-hydroxy-6-metoxy-1,4-benzoquinol methylase
VNSTTKVASAPSKVKWLASRAMHHLPLIKPTMEKKEAAQILDLAQRSSVQEYAFYVLDSGWARKTPSFDTAEPLSELEKIDVKNGSYILPNVIATKHFSRVYEYPYAVHHLKNAKKNGRILDCGCGTTSFQFYLAKQGFEVHAVDDWLPCLEKVADLKKQSNLTNLNPTFGSVFKIPFTDSYFDGATCLSVIEHALISYENSRMTLKGAINELLRVLKKGAPLVLTFDVNFGTEQRHLVPEEYAKLCEILKIEPTPLPEDRLYSSDTKEGALMGEDIAVYCVTIIKND